MYALGTCRRNGFYARCGAGVGQGAVQRRLRSPGSTEFRCILPHEVVHPARLTEATSRYIGSCGRQHCLFLLVSLQHNVLPWPQACVGST